MKFILTLAILSFVFLQASAESLLGAYGYTSCTGYLRRREESPIEVRQGYSGWADTMLTITADSIVIEFKQQSPEEKITLEGDQRKGFLKGDMVKMDKFHSIQFCHVDQNSAPQSDAKRYQLLVYFSDGPLQYIYHLIRLEEPNH